MPVPAIRGWGGNPTNTDDHQANTDTVRRLRVLNTQNSLEIPIVEGVTLTGIGMIDGALHVQIRYSDILHTDNHGFLTLTDREGKTYRDTPYDCGRDGHEQGLCAEIPGGNAGAWDH